MCAFFYNLTNIEAAHVIEAVHVKESSSQVQNFVIWSYSSNFLLSEVVPLCD